MSVRSITSLVIALYCVMFFALDSRSAYSIEMPPPEEMDTKDPLNPLRKYVEPMGSMVSNIEFSEQHFLFPAQWPIVLDLDGTGLKIDPLSSSNIYFDRAGDGYQHRTAWAGAGNGVLVLDLEGDGQIDQRNEVIFTDWDPTAGSDMQALANISSAY